MLAITIVICIFLFLTIMGILGTIEKKQSNKELTYEILGQINDELLDLRKNKVSIDDLKATQESVDKLHCLTMECRSRVDKLEKHNI